jgi:hypothetical protein
MNYKQILESIISNYLFEPWDEQTQQEIERIFKSQCPGPYIITFVGLDENNMPKFQLDFEDPVGITAWLLKWA